MKEEKKDYLGIRKGLAGKLSLGELEAEILDIIWELGTDENITSVNSMQVFRVMFPKREVSYSTIMLTMKRVAEKGLLVLEKDETNKRAPFLYTPVYTREQLSVLLMDAVTTALLHKSFSEVDIKELQESFKGIHPVESTIEES